MLHLIKESKFKTVRLMVRFREEMSADTLGKRVLISNMLESTNAVYQTGKILVANYLKCMALRLRQEWLKKGNNIYFLLI